MLTVTEVQCIPSGTATTRMHDAAHPTMSWGQMRGFKGPDIMRRSYQAVNVGLTDLASSFAQALPDVGQLSGPLRDEFSSITSALFALELCDSGVDLNRTCNELNTIQSAYDLLQEGLNPNSIKSTVCFCNTYGLDFNTTQQQLYTSLFSALTGILSAADVSTDRGRICANLDLFNRSAPYLDIDKDEYYDLVCSNTSSATPPATTTEPSGYGPPPTPLSPVITNGMTTWVSPNVTESNMTIGATGLPGGMNETTNGTTFGPPTSFNPATFGTGLSMTMPAQTNMTVAQPTGTAAASDMGSALSNNTMISAHTPRGPRSVPFYPAIITQTPRSGLFKRY